MNAPKNGDPDAGAGGGSQTTPNGATDTRRRCATSATREISSARSGSLTARGRLPQP